METCFNLMYTPTERKRYAMWELLKHRKYPMLGKAWHHHSLDLALKKKKFKND